MTKESKGVFTRPVYASPCLISGTFIGRIMKRSKHYRPEQLFIGLSSRSVWHKRCAHWNNWPRTLVCRMDSRAEKPWCNSVVYRPLLQRGDWRVGRCAVALAGRTLAQVGEAAYIAWCTKIFAHLETEFMDNLQENAETEAICVFAQFR